MRRSRTPHDPDLLKSAGCCHIEWCLHSTDNLVLLENVTVVAAFPLQEPCLGFASQPGKASKHLSRGLKARRNIAGALGAQLYPSIHPFSLLCAFFWCRNPDQKSQPSRSLIAVPLFFRDPPVLL